MMAIRRESPGSVTTITTRLSQGTAAVGTASNGTTNIYQWENVPKALVEGLEGTLNLPVGETVNWSNNLTWMLQSKNKTTGDRLSVIPQFTLKLDFELAGP